MEGLPHRQEPVLRGVDGGEDVLLDDGGEGVAHELDGVVPVAPAHGELPLDVLQGLDVRPGSRPLQAEPVPGVVEPQPREALVNQVVPLQVFGNCPLPELLTELSMS